MDWLGIEVLFAFAVAMNLLAYIFFRQLGHCRSDEGTVS
jgi:hypothetical protein